MAAVRPMFRVVFHNQGKVYEVYARKVTQGALFGFVEIEGLSFGTGSGVLVDPAEERLRTEFAGVKRSYVPLHAVVRIDEVTSQGPARISVIEGGVPGPVPLYTPGPHGK